MPENDVVVVVVVVVVGPGVVVVQLTVVEALAHHSAQTTTSKLVQPASLGTPEIWNVEEPGPPVWAFDQGTHLASCVGGQAGTLDAGEQYA
jgi:hypothetical protein